LGQVRFKPGLERFQPLSFERSKGIAICGSILGSLGMRSWIWREVGALAASPAVTAGGRDRFGAALRCNRQHGLQFSTRIIHSRVCVIAGIDKFLSISSTIEVDLLGQAAIGGTAGNFAYQGIAVLSFPVAGFPACR
jgi:hypothetical protein